jgi:hypothetical protein
VKPQKHEKQPEATKLPLHKRNPDCISLVAVFALLLAALISKNCFSSLFSLNFFMQGFPTY